MGLSGPLIRGAGDQTFCARVIRGRLSLRVTWPPAVLGAVGGVGGDNGGVARVGQSGHRVQLSLHSRHQSTAKYTLRRTYAQPQKLGALIDIDATGGSPTVT